MRQLFQDGSLWFSVRVPCGCTECRGACAVWLHGVWRWGCCVIARGVGVGVLCDLARGCGAAEQYGLGLAGWCSSGAVRFNRLQQLLQEGAVLFRVLSSAGCCHKGQPPQSPQEVGLYQGGVLIRVVQFLSGWCPYQGAVLARVRQLLQEGAVLRGAVAPMYCSQSESQGRPSHRGGGRAPSAGLPLHPPGGGAPGLPPLRAHSVCPPFCLCLGLCL